MTPVEFWLNVLSNIIGEIIVVGATAIGGTFLLRYHTFSTKVKRGVKTTSPDGTQDVYEYGGELYLDTGLVLRNLTKHKATDKSPLWSPDGRWIVFSSFRDNDWNIYVVNTKSNKMVQLTSTLGAERPMGWDKSGNLIIGMGGSTWIIHREEIEKLLE